jgi:hypothetical protein
VRWIKGDAVDGVVQRVLASVTARAATGSR